MIRVLFVDDDPRLRDCWGRLIATQNGFELVGTLDRADLLVDSVGRLKPHVVLLDLTMPGADPLEACATLTREFPDVRVIIYTGIDDPALLDAAHAAGAWGFVDKLSPPAEILDTVRLVSQGATSRSTSGRP
jgi:DNA-binding NarL/FixJ family response regulator